jgi:hypothetical protein
MRSELPNLHARLANAHADTLFRAKDYKGRARALRRSDDVRARICASVGRTGDRVDTSGPVEGGLGGRAPSSRARRARTARLQDRGVGRHGTRRLAQRTLRLAAIWGLSSTEPGCMTSSSHPTQVARSRAMSRSDPARAGRTGLRAHRISTLLKKFHDYARNFSLTNDLLTITVVYFISSPFLAFCIRNIKEL